MKAYKLVVVRDGKCTSIISEGLSTTEYFVDKPSTAPKWLAAMGYHLCVFDTFEHAEAFAVVCTPQGYYSGLYQVWEVEGIEVVEPLPPRLGIMGLVHGRTLPSQSEHGWPTGTMMMSELKLVRKV